MEGEGMINQEQLNAIKERLGNATDGPWQVYEMEDGTQIGTTEHHPQLNGPMHVVTMSYWGEKPYSRVWIDKDNAEFIAKAREDVPALVEYIESLHELRKDDFLVMCESKDEVRKMRLKFERLRKALEEIMEDQAPIMEGWETTTYKIARKALGGEAHE